MRMYGLGSYFMGKTMPELPLQAIGPVYIITKIFFLLILI
jgi:hypothetical protein